VIRYLLDVNVLIALVDPAHVQHEAVHTWFGRVGRKAFATCPLTENGLLRIVGHPKYPNSPGPPGAVAEALASIRALPGHVFWADSISLAEEDRFDLQQLTGHALARANDGRLATLDHRLNVGAVVGGAGCLALI
jgi:uncharacterized protein